jgi:hypothetical protein
MSEMTAIDLLKLVWELMTLVSCLVTMILIMFAVGALFCKLNEREVSDE